MEDRSGVLTNVTSSASRGKFSRSVWCDECGVELWGDGEVAMMQAMGNAL